MLRISLNPVRFIALLSFLFSFASCEKEEPSTEATLETTMRLFTNAAVQGKVTIQQTSFALNELEIVADNKDGNQSTYTQTNPDQSVITLSNSERTLPFVYATKQGSYEPIDLFLRLAADDHQLQVTPGDENTPATVNFEDFLANASPSVMMTGTYNNRGQTVRIYIAIDVINDIRVRASQKTATTINLSKANKAQILFDPSFIMEDITTLRLEAATTFMYNNETILLIHRDFNSSLYDDIEDRLLEEGAFRVEMIQMPTNG